MPRNRIVKSEFWSSEQVIACSIQARLLFIGMWNWADDHGIHQASYVRLKAEIYPCDPFTINDIKQWINELITNNLLREYYVNDVAYWIVTGWKKHQQINKPTYRHPLPQSDLKQIENSSNTTAELPEHSSSSIGLVREDYGSSTGGVATNKKENEKENKKKDIREVVPTSPFPISKTETIASSDVLKIFQYWQQVLNHQRAKLDNKRRRRIENALKVGYSVDELKNAIDGCSKSKFNMGSNDSGQRYDDIELILRDAAHIDRFIDVAGNNSSEQENLMVGAL